MTAAPLDRRLWHEGEKAARVLAGAPDIAPVIRTFLTDQHRDFFARLPLVFVAGLDRSGAPKASLLRGQPGFIACPDPRRVEIAARFAAEDSLALKPGAPFGLIGVDFTARRRNRINGHILSAGAGGLTLAVDEAFGNCPKYIAPRALNGGSDAGAWRDLPSIEGAARSLIQQAEVFFIATRGPDGVDISHRGGPPGFVALQADGTLRIKDFPGNNYFNTFGNLLHDPRAALLFVDFPAGRALHLAGEARLSLSREERSWTFAPSKARMLALAEPLGGPASKADMAAFCS
jgi:predicted pyridoxine 5'-phosphate oxidase superfamily flavin-nucleotide-binding protein